MSRRAWGTRRRASCAAIGLAVFALAHSSGAQEASDTAPAPDLTEANETLSELNVSFESSPADFEPSESIWETQIRDDMRRDIEERERLAWEDAERAAAAEAAMRARLKAQRDAGIPDEPIAAPIGRLTSEALVSPRLESPHNAYSPLARRADRAAKRAAAEGGDSLAYEVAGWSYLYEALGIRASAIETARLTTELAPSDASSWHRLARLEFSVGDVESAREALTRSSGMSTPPLDLSALVEPAYVAPARIATSAPNPSPSVPTDASNFAQQARSLLATLTDRGRRGIEAAREFSSRAEVRRYALLGLVGALAMFVVFRATRRRGDLMVHIVYPTELRGTFRVQLDSQRRRWRRRSRQTEPELMKGGASSASEHFLVARETPFRRLVCRKYFVTVDGLLQDPRTNEVIGHPFLQTSVYVRHRRTVRLDIDATPSECPVDVRVVWDGAPVRSALVTARDRAMQPVETDAGTARLALAHGNYTIAAGSGDRVAERVLRVRSHLATKVEIDLARPDGVVFKACPPAVEPYLSGHYESAASALTRDGQADSAHRLLANRCREQGNDAEAALHFEAASEWLEAAELHSTLGNYAHAGELFGRANDPISAAEMFQLASEPIRAGRAYEDARDFESAIECYREAGDAQSWVEALERRGDLFEAARTALANSLPTRGIRLLQRVSPDDPHYREACVLLADTFERERHFDLAARKLSDYVSASSADQVEPAIYARLADLHEKSGDLESALEVLESLRLIDPSFPNLATRAEHLRKARSAKRHLTSSSGSLMDGGPPTVMLAEERYEVLDEIGRGGMGVVSRARDRRLGRVVALKRLSENLHDQPRAVELFLREARAAAALNHVNIVTVYDADQEDENLFITMELLDGSPLQQLLRRSGRLPSVEIARIGQQVCAGLAYAHERGVIHRDVKTANLFVCSDQRVKIMDFGLAKVAQEVRRGHSLVGGTPYYMAPEQTLGENVDHRVDLYSLGVTLFELATGRVPFPDGDAAHHNRHSLPPNPLELVSDLDARLVEVILDLLEKDPERRPATAAEVGRRLAALDPNPAPRPGWDDSAG